MVSDNALPPRIDTAIPVNADVPARSEDGASSLATGARPPHPARLSSAKSDPLPVVERATSRLPRIAGEESVGAVPVVETAIRGFENSVASSMGLLLSSVSLSVDRRDNLDRQSSVQRLARLAARARMFRSADGRFCAQVPGGRSARDLWAQVGGVSRLADRWVHGRPARAAVELGDSPRDRDARGPRAVQHGHSRSICPRRPGRRWRPTRLISSTWAIPAAGPSRFAIRAGASSIGPAFTFAGLRDYCRCPMPARDGSIELVALLCQPRRA